MTGLALLLSILIAVGLTYHAIQIAAERDKAERNLEAARRAVEEFAKISDNRLLEDPGAQPLRRELVLTAMNYYQEFLAQNRDSPVLAAEVAATYFRLWQLQRIVGEPQKAQQALERGLAVLEELLAREPGLKDLAPLVGVYRFSHTLTRKPIAPADPEQHLDCLRRCLTIWQGLAQKYPDVTGFQHDLANFYFDIAFTQQRAGDLDAALRSATQSVEISTRLVQQHPECAQCRRELSQYCQQWGRVYYGGMDDLAHELEWLERAVKADPSNPEAYNATAWVLATDPNPKLRDPRRAVDLARKAVAIEPRDADCWNTLGVAQYRANDWRSAVDSLDKSMLLRDGGDGFDWYFVAMAYRRLGEKSRAEEFFRKAEAWKQKEHITARELTGIDQEAKTLLAASATSP
jgi:tetratricopeptide (TPR) repeat protein